DVPDNSTIVGVPGHIIFRDGKRVVITDPKEIRDPLSDALAALADQVQKLEDTVKELTRERDEAGRTQNTPTVSSDVR
ncbi:MAG: hypothetical protein ACLP2H_18735, partial [Terriglobales bacterium]